MTKTPRLFGSLLLAGLSVSAAGCGAEKADSGSTTSKADALKPQAVQAATVVLKDRLPVVETTGTLVPRRRAELRAMAEGRVDQVPVDIGTPVKEGQVVFQVRLAEYENAYRQASAALARAKVALADRDRERGRMEGLFKEGSATEQMRDQAATAYEDAVAGLKEAEARAAISQQALEDCTGRSPYDGVITMRSRQRGEYVSRGDVVVEVMDLKVLEAEMEVPEPYAGKIRVGLSVELDVRGGLKGVAGTVVAVNPKVDVATRTFTVKVQVDNGDLTLQAGLFCAGRFKLPAEPDKAAIPASALSKDEGRSTVWLIQDGRVHRKQVTADGTMDGFVFVDEGLHPGDQVVSGGGGGLFEGAPVTLAAPEPSPATSQAS